MGYRVVIPGGSGQVGNILARALTRLGHEITILSRQPQTSPWRTIFWDATTLGAWTQEIDGADIVINLAGRSVNCRYNPANRAAILASRVDSTRVVGQAIAAAARPPRLWLQASTATIYAHRFDAANDEENGIIDDPASNAPSSWRFSLDVARAWEAELAAAEVGPTRKVAMRAAMVMSPDADGIFDTLLSLVRRGLGGTAGNGRQFVSWIHEQDFVNAITWLIDHENIAGAINLAAPNPLPNKEFMAALRAVAGVKIGLPATSWMLEIGALFMGTETELILKSRRVVPKRLLDQGFEFKYPTWPEAASELMERRRAQRGSASSSR
jgi:uncharacterized protein